MIRNDYSSTSDKFAWTDMGIVFDGGGCPNHHGVGLFDMGVRFADITGKYNGTIINAPQNNCSNNIVGNGFPDYLCIDPDGRTTAWINTNMQFVSLGQVKFSVGADRGKLSTFALIQRSRALCPLHLVMFQNRGSMEDIEWVFLTSTQPIKSARNIFTH